MRDRLDKVDQLRSHALDALDAVATQLEGDAKAATGRDATRLNALAETLKGRAARLR